MSRSGSSWRQSRAMHALGYRPGDVGSLPFSPGDVTAGTEFELQAAVVGDANAVDLPRVIRESSYYENASQRVRRDEAPRKAISGIERFLSENSEGVWENSWVRIPHWRLNANARATLLNDLRADKRETSGPLRADAHRFLGSDADGEQMVHVPISYLLKLSLAHLLGERHDWPPELHRIAAEVMKLLTSDNSSPETASFYLVNLDTHGGGGAAVATEAAERTLFCHLLLAYANAAFRMEETGQNPIVYFSPNPPQRLRRLNDSVSDTYFRELFCSPCLSGWDRGLEKHEYMLLCHQVLSRSRLNAMAILREAGLIVGGLVSLPNTSSTSLANNGVHVSLGSSRLTQATAADEGFGPSDEKYVGDLAIKVMEHILPVFVGTYTAAPYRIGFHDFRPEKIMGFLPHELHYTHLRMLWRRWKKKARIRCFGQAVTPSGPRWFDKVLTKALPLHGDYVPDFRLLDYLVGVGSTDESPSLDGSLGNDIRLRRDLAALGVFDEDMSVYQLCKQRRQPVVGYSGFESRYYSLFPDPCDDMARAVDLQWFMTTFAYHLIGTGQVHHGMIADTRFVESERRQFFFAAAAGIPLVYVRRNSANTLLLEILRHTEETRPSKRYRGYLKVRLEDYRRAVVRWMRARGAPVIEMLGAEDTLRDLDARLRDPSLRASNKITDAVLRETGARTVFDLRPDEFNAAVERHLRTTLRQRTIARALIRLESEWAQAGVPGTNRPEYRHDHVVSGEIGEDGCAVWMRALLERCASQDRSKEIA